MPAVHEQELKKKLEEVWQSGGVGRLALQKEIEKHIPIFSPKDLPIVTTKAARYHGNPVLTRGGPGAWDEGRVDNPCVVWDADTPSHPYWMWYSGRDANNRNGKVGLAMSSDGITWTKRPENPVTPTPSATRTTTQRLQASSWIASTEERFI